MASRSGIRCPAYISRRALNAAFACLRKYLAPLGGSFNQSLGRARVEHKTALDCGLLYPNAAEREAARQGNGIRFSAALGCTAEIKCHAPAYRWDHVARRNRFGESLVVNSAAVCTPCVCDASELGRRRHMSA